MKRSLVAVIAVVVLGAGCGSSSSGLATVAVDAEAAADLSYVIPAGTGARLDDGEVVELLPARIEAEIGDVIRIENDDDRGHLLGPFYVGAHETMTQRFSSAGTFVGMCAVHPSGELVVEVTDPGT